MDLRKDIKKNICFNEIGLHAQNTLSILGSLLNMVEGTYTSTYEHENIHFNTE
jgi:hypothetical protein